MKKILMFICCFFLIFIPIAHANTLYEGYLTTNIGDVEHYGIYATDPWKMQIKWHITTDGSDNFPIKYSYLITAENGGSLKKDISHLILEISKNASLINFADFRGVGEIELGNYSNKRNDGIGIPDGVTIYGLKFSPANCADALVMKISFDSDRLPMWGNFYIQDGKYHGNPVYAFNIGMKGEGAFIAVPDTTCPPPAVPTPGTFLLLVAGLLYISSKKLRK